MIVPSSPLHSTLRSPSIMLIARSNVGCNIRRTRLVNYGIGRLSMNSLNKRLNNLTHFPRRIFYVAIIFLIMMLVSISGVSANNITSEGLWSDPNTWGGTVPTVDSAVVIPTGVNVIVDVPSIDVDSITVPIDTALTFTDIDTVVRLRFIDVDGAMTMSGNNQPAENSVTFIFYDDPQMLDVPTIDVLTDTNTPIQIDIQAENAGLALDVNTLALATQPNSGSAIVPNLTDGVIEYTPDSSFVGAVSFTYDICDASGVCGTGIINITIEEATVPNDIVISGDLMQWHRVSLTFDGPEGSESTPATFWDYRLMVTFSNGQTTYTVPGFFAADGDAANTGATSGNKWRVHFTPDAIGEWTYTASFRTGSQVAISLDPNAGAPSSFDGATGSFNVTASTAPETDFRYHGMLRYVGGHYLQFAGSGDYYLKSGADSPENFLGYSEFDGTFDTGGLINNFLHDYAPHVSDWRAGDPTWGADQRGQGIIGAINYLADQGVNSYYFITYNIDGGDGADTWPWTDPSARDTFDISKLDQWEIVFSHMTARGIQLHFLTQETENDGDLGGNGDLNPIRQLYYREMVARFSHHPALQWNLGEENSNSDQQRRDFAAYIRAFDAYNHPITVHSNYNSPANLYDDLFGDPNFEATSIQGNANNYNGWAIEFRNSSASASRPWSIYGDEQGPAVNSNMNNVDQLRKDALWGNLMGGGAGVEWYFGYQGDFGDVQSEDFHVAQPLWEDSNLAVEFFQTYLPFWEMTPDNTLVSDGYALAKTGDTYAIYLPDGGSTSLTLPDNNTYDIFWYNPRTGGELQIGSIARIAGAGAQSIGNPPSDNNQDWAVLVVLSDDVINPPSDDNPSALIEVTAGSGLGASTYGDDSFVITNTGDVDIVNVTIDISTSFMPDIVFDPIGTAGDSVAKCVTEGSLSIGDVGITIPANGGSDVEDCESVFAQPHNGINADEGYDVLSLDFTDFNPNEAFAFGVDIDPTSIKGDLTSGDAGSISGFELIGATVRVEFADATTITTTLTDEGSLGGSQAVVEQGLPSALSIAVDGLSTNPASVTNANQTIIVTGVAGEEVTLIQIDARLYIDPGNPNIGYDVDPFEANEVVAKMILTGVIPADGTLELPITLLETSGANNTPDGGLNHFIAFHNDSANSPIGLGSNVLVLTLDDNVSPEPTDTPEPNPTDTPELEPTDEEPNPVNLSITQLVLVNAQDNSDIGILNDGSVINLAALHRTSLNVRAETNPSVVGSVTFALNGSNQTENVSPYAMQGDNNGNYNEWTPNVGSYTLTVTAYANSGSSGESGHPLTITFEVVDEDGGDSGVNQAPIIAPIPNSSVMLDDVVSVSISATDANNDAITLSASGLPNFLTFTDTGDGTGQITGTASAIGSSFITITASDGENNSTRSFSINVNDSTPTDGNATITGFTLVDATTGNEIQPLQNNDVVDVLPTANLAVRAEYTGSVQEVVFNVNGTTSTDSTNDFSVPVALGEINLTATPYEQGSLISVNYADYGYDANRNPVTIPSNAIRLNPDDNVENIVDSYPAGTAFVFSPGIYRMQSIDPKDNQQFYGELGAVLNGSRLLTDFVREGNYWVATGQTQQYGTHGACDNEYPRCKHAEDLFFDDVPLRHVESLSQVVSGTWYFDYDADRIYFADDPTGHTVETSVADYAFRSSASNVVINNLTIEKYANRAQSGAIHGDNTLGWIVHHNIIQWNHGVGIRLGDGMHVYNNYVVDNGQIGIGGLGDNIIIEWNDIARNNYAGYDDEWEAGGTKFVLTDNLIVRNNYVYENYGPGLWTDIDNINTLYDSNLVMNNLTIGIFHEISYDAIIRNNVSIYNAITEYPWLYGAQILISSSRNADIYNNRIIVSEFGGNGITVLQQNRGTGVYGVRSSLNNYIHDNIIVHLGNEGINGIGADWDQNNFFNNGNNIFNSNTYYLNQENIEYWHSRNRDSWNEFQAVGQEANGTVFYDADPDAVIAGTSLGIQFTLNEVVEATAPAMPTNLNIQNLDITQMSLAWNDNADNETLYEIERDGISLTSIPADSTDYTDTSLTADTNYCYRVRAVNDTGQSEWSHEICATTLAEPTVLGAPTNLLAQTLDTSQIELTWADNATSETLYEIERDGVSLTSIPADSVIHTDINLTPDTSYCYRVRAVDNVTESAWSNEVCATTLPEQVIVSAPSNPIAQAVDSTEIELTWVDNANNETLYEIERDGTSIMVLPPDSTVYFDTGLTAETNYCYRVRAVSDTVPSNWSNEVCATTLADASNENQAPTLETPSDQTNTVGDSVNLQLTYNDPEGGIVRFTSIDLPSDLNVDATTGVITGTPISAGTYNVTITVVDDGGLQASMNFNWTILPQADGDDNQVNAITRLILVDANSNQDIMELTDGIQVNLSNLPSTNLNIRAETTDDVSSVRFGLNANSNFRNENVAPYALVGDSNGNYNAWSPNPGTYTVTATPYTEDNGNGSMGAGRIVSFTVVSSTTVVPQSTANPDSDEPVPTPEIPNNTLGITSLMLVDANSNQDVMVLTDGIEISLSALPSPSINVRAETTDDVESVRFGLNTNNSFALENVAPYTLLGDNNGNYNAWAPSPGIYTLTVTPYSQGNGGGNTGLPLTLTFTITP